MDLFYEYTSDNLLLQGTYFESHSKDICILFIHGQAQSIIDNKFIYLIAKTLSNFSLKICFFRSKVKAKS